jgi:hypothetical protein
LPWLGPVTSPLTADGTKIQGDKQMPQLVAAYADTPHPETTADTATVGTAAESSRWIVTQVRHGS